MIKALLRKGDGMGERAWLNSVVKNVQLGLIRAGQPMTADGMFGSGTLDAVNGFQQSQGMGPTEQVDRSTWAALDVHLQAAIGADAARVAEILERFDGDLGWVHQQEGHKGRPYWPGGHSGVTLDPGVDLGQFESQLFEQLYGPLVSESEMEALRRVLGINRRGGAKRAGSIFPHSGNPDQRGASSRHHASRGKEKLLGRDLQTVRFPSAGGYPALCEDRFAFACI